MHGCSAFICYIGYSELKMMFSELKVSAEIKGHSKAVNINLGFWYGISSVLQPLLQMSSQ